MTRPSRWVAPQELGKRRRFLADERSGGRMSSAVFGRHKEARHPHRRPMRVATVVMGAYETFQTPVKGLSISLMTERRKAMLPATAATTASESRSERTPRTRKPPRITQEAKTTRCESVEGLRVAR